MTSTDAVDDLSNLSSALESQAELCIKLLQADTYQSKPNVYLDHDYDQFSTGLLKKVPVLRLFGTDRNGGKVCVHIHNAFPYLYIPFTLDYADDEKKVQCEIQRLGFLMNTALGLQTSSFAKSDAPQRNGFVVATVLVKGIPIYGFHADYGLFLKVYLTDQFLVYRLAELLRSGSIDDRVFPVFESHLPFILQFMIDYNLVGMGNVYLRRVVSRKPSAKFMQWPQSTGIRAVTTCGQEFDAWSCDILNRRLLKERELEPLVSWAELQVSAPLQSKLTEATVPSVREMYKDEFYRRKRFNMEPYSCRKEPDRPQEMALWSTRIERVANFLSGLGSAKNATRRNKYYEYQNVMTVFQSANSLDLRISMLKQPLEFADVQNELSLSLSVRSSNSPFCTQREACGLLTQEELIGLHKQQLELSQSYKSCGKLSNSSQTLSPESKRLAELLGGWKDQEDNLSDQPPSDERLPTQPTAAVVNSDDADSTLVSDTVGNVEARKSEINSDADIEETCSNEEYDLDCDDNIWSNIQMATQQGEFGPAQAYLTPQKKSGLDMMSVASKESDKQILSRFPDILQSIESAAQSPPKDSNPFLLKQSSRGERATEESSKNDSRSESISTPVCAGPIPFSKDQANLRLENNSCDQGIASLNSSQFSHGSQGLGGIDIEELGKHIDSLVPTSKKRATSAEPQPTTASKVQVSGTWKRIGLSFCPSLACAPAICSQPDVSFQSLSPTPSNSGFYHPALFNEPIFPSRVQLGESPTSVRRKELARTRSAPIRPAKPSRRWLPVKRGSSLSRFSVQKLIDEKKVLNDGDDGDLSGPVHYGTPFYSAEKDVPQRSTVMANTRFWVRGHNLESLPPFPNALIPTTSRFRYLGEGQRWTRAIGPPSRAAVAQLVNVEHRELAESKGQPDTATDSEKGNIQSSGSLLCLGNEALTLLLLEVHVITRPGMSPDPSRDEIGFIAFCIFSGQQNTADSRQSGIIVQSRLHKTPLQNLQTICADDEMGILSKFRELVSQADPDIVIGFQVATMSLGYLCRRADLLGLVPSYTKSLSRVPPTCSSAQWDFDGKASTEVVPGRIVINGWRALMSYNESLRQYSFENYATNILGVQTPLYSYDLLTKWYRSAGSQFKTVAYYVNRVEMTLEMIEKVRVLLSSAEFARVFGVDLASVLTRGSQYKVESMMCRLAREENFLMLSPGHDDIRHMNASEAVPLVMEPESKLYNDPVIVVDFQSLYPSIMKAYNYCFSTCLGKVASIDAKQASTTVKLGVSSLEVNVDELKTLKNHVHVAPNGAVYVKSCVRQGVLGRLLSGMLDARVMVKQSMKLYGTSYGNLLDLLDSRQKSLKLIANVTYGYTSASFSGRMPCVDVADSIVSTARLILEQSTKLIHEHSTLWGGARVVYGDTDSLFVMVPNRSRKAALSIGSDIVRAITNSFPIPVKLKLEKVYLPCVLQTKKRYVGYAYETDSISEVPKFDAKGIETVRRDGCEATSQLLEQCLRILFEKKDLSLVKMHLYSVWTRILKNQVSYRPFIISRAVYLGRYKNPPPGALVAMRKIVADPCCAPQAGERVPYIVVSGAPNMRLMDSVQSPEVLVESPELLLHANYYITKQMIPSLSRVFSLFGVDVMQWYQQMPKAVSSYSIVNSTPKRGANTTIESYYSSSKCRVCLHNFRQKESNLCRDCEPDSQLTTLILGSRRHEIEREYQRTIYTCRKCVGGISTRGFESSNNDSLDCRNISCPVYFRKQTLVKKIKTLGVELDNESTKPP